ncbi:hypothetical protein NPIL_535771, partial [Nephila pilipes]
IPYLILYVEELTRYEKLSHDVLTAQKTFEEELDDSIVKSIMTISLSQRRCVTLQKIMLETKLASSWEKTK